MNIHKLSKRTIFNIMTGVLAFSVIFNAAFIVKVSKYSYKINMEAYNYIEDVKLIHENNEQILSKTIDVGNIDNMSVLKLYKNYGDLSEDINYLYNEYIYYKDNRQFINLNRNMDIGNISDIDLNSKVQDFLEQLLEKEMQNDSNKIELNGGVKEDFIELYNLEKEKVQYYVDFSNNNLNYSEEDKKKDKIIKKHYWVDILEGYNKINKNYIDYEFHKD